jgi:hypothetical protein
MTKGQEGEIRAEDWPLLTSEIVKECHGSYWRSERD